MRRLSSIFIHTPSAPTADLTTLPQKLAFSGNDASAYGCPKNALGLGGGFRPHRRCWRSRPDLGERWPCRLVATATVNPLQLILDSERPDPICYRPSTISVSRRANARDIASRNRK